MKIAVFASANGDKARHLHDFFKEGNRVSIEVIYTDNPYSPLIEEMRAEGIEVVVLTPDQDGSRMAESLRDRGVELLVEDDFQGRIPEEVKEAYGEAIVAPASPQSAPLDVITTIDRINAALRNVQEEKSKVQSPKDESDGENGEPASDIDQEWAEVLEVEIDSPEKPAPERQEPPVYIEQSPQQPAPPPYGWGARRPSPTPPPYGNPAPGAVNQPHQEPMPDTYLVWSVIITILCCLIPGIIAIIYSASVSSKYFRGDIEGAKKASRNAQIWCIVSIVAGIIWSTLYVPLSLFVP